MRLRRRRDVAKRQRRGASDDHTVRCGLSLPVLMRAVQVEADFLGVCPCGQKVYANAEECTVLHAEPMCQKFDELDPLDFVIWMRMSLGIKSPEDN